MLVVESPPFLLVENSNISQLFPSNLILHTIRFSSPQPQEFCQLLLGFHMIHIPPIDSRGRSPWLHGLKSGWFIMWRPQVDTRPLPSQLRERPRLISRVGSLPSNMGHLAIEVASWLLPIRLHLQSVAQLHSAIAASSSNQQKLRERVSA